MKEWNDGSALYHYGILGQKRGERRFQNPDGTYTEEGLKRKRATYPTKDQIKNRVVDSGQVKSALNQGKQITDNLRNLNKDIPSKSKDWDVNNKTDQELRNEVNRMLLENQYINLKNQRTAKTGREYLNDVLSVAGDVLAIGASVAAIYQAVWTIRNK